MIRNVFSVLVCVAVVGGCGADETKAPVEVTTKASTATTTPSPTPTVDPYDVYLKNVPKGQPTLSRADASTRALLGCGQKWPPGTTDAVLAEAYAVYC